MRFRQHEFFLCTLMMVFAIVALNVTSHAQSVIISHNASPTPVAPATFTVTAAPTMSVQKVVFYRNDVPFYTDSTGANCQPSTYCMPQTIIGQETYTYYARAYTSATSWYDSTSITVTVNTPRFLRMGDSVPTPTPTSSPTPVPTATPTPMGANRYNDHTDYIEHAIEYLSEKGGGTLFFPCTGGLFNGVPNSDPQSIYNISRTIVIPSNITLQGEGADSPEGRCRIYWRDPAWNPDDDPEVEETPDHCYDNDDPKTNPGINLLGKPMFQINSGTTGVRFRDMFLYSRSSGPSCHVRQDWTRIKGEKTVGIALYGYTGDIKDIILENVSINNFTWGIKAATCIDDNEEDEIDPPCTGNEHKIYDIRMRGVRPTGNHRQLYINAKYAYEWDVQNFNITGMGLDQGGVELVNTGRPSPYTGENGKLKFLNLNCNGNDRTPEFCVDIKKHGGLYFKQLHHEGVNRALRVNSITDVNAEPIVMEGSGATGEFYDDSMKLYLIGNNVFSSPDSAPANEDNGRFEFFGDGLLAKIVDCGDLHWDRTDTVPSTPPSWADWKMQYTHSERNRSSFFVPLTAFDFPLDMPHRVCPSAEPNTSEIGGEHFDTGVLPVEPLVYSSTQVFTTSSCDGDGDCKPELQEFLDRNVDRRTLVIKGAMPVKQTITIPSGRQIVGIPDASSTPPQINFTPPTPTPTPTPPSPAPSPVPLFEIKAPTASEGPRTAGVTIRNLKMVQTNTHQIGTVGVAIFGGNDTEVPGALSDVHFSGITIEGFETGFYAGRQPGKGDPMLDGVSLKNFSFINNKTSVRLYSSNASNWNVLNVAMQSNSANAEGWDQKYGGHSLQNVTCQGSASYDMKDCIRLEMAHSYVTGLKKTQYVTNVVTIKEGSIVNVNPLDPRYESFQTSHLLIRNSDLRTENSGKFSLNLAGKAFIVSMNNKYDYFPSPTANNSFYEGELSRVTTCGDTGDTFSELQTVAYNNYVGFDTPTVMRCSSNPIAWEEPIKWGQDGDVPLVGNFYHDVTEDHVVYRPGSSARFLIRQAQGNQTRNIQWGTTGDLPVVGRFFATTLRSQIAIFRESNGQWWMYDPNTSTSAVDTWGTTGDKPIVGNFFSEGPIPADQRDEIAVYRPSTKTFWIKNPRSTYYEQQPRTSNIDYGTNFQVGDFLNRGYDQVAQFQNGNWHIKDLDTGYEESIVFGTTGDIPVAGKYFNQSCTQLGVWNPGAQEFQVTDAKASCSSSGIRSGAIEWGLSYVSTTSADDDIPLVMKGSDGLARPTALRRIAADPVFTFFAMKHRWWVHDPITPNP